MRLKSEAECKAIIEGYIQDAMDCLHLNVGDSECELTSEALVEELKEVSHEEHIAPDISAVYNLVSLADAIEVDVDKKYKAHAALFANKLFD